MKPALIIRKLKTLTLKSVLSVIAFSMFGIACTKQKEKIETQVDGNALYATVKQFVAIGEHRTATVGDSITSAWLKTQLDSIGAKTEFVEFPLQQFFFESGKLTFGDKTAEVFPVWPVKAGLNLSLNALIADGDKASKISDVKGKIALTRLKHAHGATTPKIDSAINAFISAGAIGVIAVTENNTGEIVALNTYDGLKPWNVPVYNFAPKDTAILLEAISKKSQINIEVKGEVKEAIARDVVGRIGSGKQFVVISTPISGWFRTGGERGPGIAVWLGLAKWVAANPEKFKDYTFVFTGNSGHELSYLGSKFFVEKAAPKIEDTKLWIHLGAAVAVRSWKEDNGQWALTDSVDGKRGIYYDESVATAFEAAFANLKAKTTKGIEANKETIKPGGEGVVFKKAGYKNLVSMAYGHRLHHIKTDDETATSPEILAELEKALQEFILLQLNPKNN